MKLGSKEGDELIACGGEEEREQTESEGSGLSRWGNGATWMLGEGWEDRSRRQFGAN